MFHWNFRKEKFMELNNLDKQIDTNFNVRKLTEELKWTKNL